MDELRVGVKEWIAKKFDHPKKHALRQKLHPGKWTRELVVHNVAHSVELEELEWQGIRIHRLRDVVKELSSDGAIVPKAGGADFAALVVLGTEAPSAAPPHVEN